MSDPEPTASIDTGIDADANTAPNDSNSGGQKDALLAWLNSLELSHVTNDIADLCDGSILFEVLNDIDSKLFRTSESGSLSQSINTSASNWVLRFNHLKRMYKLIMHYFEESLNMSTTELVQPNLQAIAKDLDETQTVQLTCIVLALAVQSHQNAKHVSKIQGLDEWAQRELMGCIENIMQTVSDKVNAPVGESDQPAETSHLSEQETSALYDKLAQSQTANETLQVAYDELAKQLSTLREDHEDVLKNLSISEEKLAEQARQAPLQADRSDSSLKAEIDRLRGEWQKSENRLGDAEVANEKYQSQITDMTRRINELQAKADQADVLADKVDELRHSEEKLQKAENVIEKYKRKLEGGADLKRSIKTLEEQNSNLVERNSEIEDEYRKVSAFKPLMESYKKKMDELETKGGEMAKEIDVLKFDLNKKTQEVKVLTEEKAKQDESLELYEARVKELELETGGKKTRRKTSKGGENGAGDGSVDEDDPDLDDDDLDDDQEIGGELHDAMRGTTMTDLKIQVRKLKRDLQQAQANKADASRIVVLENLLEDANRMKSKYETDYLNEHREKLVFIEQIEQIRSGKSSSGNGPEAAIALRQRLNEVSTELDQVKLELNELKVQNETLSNKLVIAESDLNLVNKDQVDILASLRASVAVDKETLEEQVKNLKEDKSKLELEKQMQTSQINTLLMDKVGMQSDSIEQREKMLATERDMGMLKLSLAGKGLSEEEQERIAKYEEKTHSLEDKLRDSEEKLNKARAFIRQQDQKFREQHADEIQLASEERTQELQARLKHYEEELAREKGINADLERTYKLENSLMLSAWSEDNHRQVRESLIEACRRAPTAPSSWLGQQRTRSAGNALR